MASTLTFLATPAWSNLGAWGRGVIPFQCFAPPRHDGRPTPILVEDSSVISLADLQRRIDQGPLSPEAALKQALDAIAENEKAIGAFASLAQNPRAQKTGPLRGIA